MNQHSESALELVWRHHERSLRLIHLVPSENTPSLRAASGLVSDAQARYSFLCREGSNPAWPGTDLLDLIERRAQESLRQLFNVHHVDTNSISGINCMTAVLAALKERTDTIFSIPTTAGGHGSTRAIASYLGIRVKEIPFRTDSLDVDLEALSAATSSVEVPVLYLDQFMCLFPLDVSGMRGVLGDHAVIHYDGSHVMGLVAGGRFQDPLREGADALSGSLHKTFPGVHKAVILSDVASLFEDYSRATNVFVSHRHAGDSTAMAVVCEEMLDDADDLAARIVANARALGSELYDRGVGVLWKSRGFTDSHQLWIDPASFGTAERVAGRLFEAGIVVNAIPVPYLSTGNGLRLGVQEVTRAGLDVDDMRSLALLLAEGMARGADLSPQAVGARERLLEQITAARKGDLEVVSLVRDALLGEVVL